MRGLRNASREAAAADPGPGKPRHSRPDPKPSRLVVGAGAVAALSIIGAGLVRFPVNADGANPGQAEVAAPARAAAKPTAKRPVKYVRLKPGQKAPRGAKVIREKAPPPRIVVIRAGTSTVTSTPIEDLAPANGHQTAAQGPGGQVAGDQDPPVGLRRHLSVSVEPTEVARQPPMVTPHSEPRFSCPAMGGTLSLRVACPASALGQAERDLHCA